MDSGSEWIVVCGEGEITLFYPRSRFREKEPMVCVICSLYNLTSLFLVNRVYREIVCETGTVNPA